MDNSSFVSRGGTKLQAAVDQFELKVTGSVCLDVGCSTGGFVDCLLQNGAAKVYALDTAYGELAWKLRNNQQVVVMERTNILHVHSFPEPVDLITIDAGWTKLELILRIIGPFLKPQGQIIALLKPHYQAEKSKLVKGVLPEIEAEALTEHFIKHLEGQGVYKVSGVMASPILGGAGNTEYLLHLQVISS